MVVLNNVTDKKLYKYKAIINLYNLNCIVYQSQSITEFVIWKY